MVILVLPKVRCYGEACWSPGSLDRLGPLAPLVREVVHAKEWNIEVEESHHHNFLTC